MGGKRLAFLAGEHRLDAALHRLRIDRRHFRRPGLLNALKLLVEDSERAGEADDIEQRAGEQADGGMRRKSALHCRAFRGARSEERRVGKECGGTCSSRWG